MLRDDLDLVAAYLARRDLLADDDPFDVLVLCGSAVLATLDTAAEAMHTGRAGRLLVTGGVGHSTIHLREAVRLDPRYADVATEGRSEAAVMAEILIRHHGVTEEVVSIEEESAHCGANAELSVALLRRSPGPWRSLLLVQDPTMQRRTHACFHRALRADHTVRISSRAPFVPAAPVGDGPVLDDDGRQVWTRRRFVALVLGEVRRLRDDEHGYGPRGADFIDHVDLPDEVLAAHHRLVEALPDVASGR